MANNERSNVERRRHRSYRNPPELTREMAEEILTADADPRDTAEALISVSMFDGDREYAERQAMCYAGHPDAGVRSAAAIALGHVARRFGRVDIGSVVPVLEALAQDPATAGAAANAIEDIEVFCN